MPFSSGVRVVAAFEAVKGGLVLLAGFGLLALVHHDLQSMAERLVECFHLNPASRYPRVFVRAASALTDTRLWLLAVGAAAYAAMRFVEAYGLWRQRRWAVWIAMVSGGVYVPIEVYELAQGVTWPRLAMLITNAAIVVYTGHAFSRSRLSDRETTA